MVLWFRASSRTQATSALGGVNDHDYNDVANIVSVPSIATE